MAVEAKRGCGYRKVGGLYLVGGGAGMPCDRLPIPLTVCPCCHAGFKQSRGWTWVDVALLVGGVHRDCQDVFPCPLCMATSDIGKAGLLWIGAKFYPTPQDFDREGVALGLSRRIAAIPRDFKIGETWVLLAHPNTIRVQGCAVEGCACETPDFWQAGIFKVWRPSRIEKIITDEQAKDADLMEDLPGLLCRPGECAADDGNVALGRMVEREAYHYTEARAPTWPIRNIAGFGSVWGRR